jgi:hypothetical protein
MEMGVNPLHLAAGHVPLACYEPFRRGAVTFHRGSLPRKLCIAVLKMATRGYHGGLAGLLAEIRSLDAPTLRPLAPAIRASMAQRRTEALDTAFARRDFAAVCQIAALLPSDGLAARMKRSVAALPEPARGLLAGMLLALGSARRHRYL